MIIVILGFIVGIIYTIADGLWHYTDTIGDVIWKTIVSIATGFICALLFLFVIAVPLPMNTYVKQTQSPIVSLKDNSTIKGNFHLLSGQIKNEMVYAFYTKNNNSYRLITVPANITTIKYTKEQPCIIQYEKELNKSWVNWFAVDLTFNRHYVIKVPEGTIKNQFMLDAE